MLPVSGPFTKTDANGRKSWKQSVGYRQKAPFDLTLRASMLYKYAPYGYDTRQPGVDLSNIDDGRVSPQFTIASLPTGMKQDAENKAWSRLQSSLRNAIPFEKDAESSGLGINIVQRKEAVSMMTLRVGSLIRFVRHLRRLELGKATEALGILPNDPRVKKLNRFRKTTSRSRHFGNLFLEYHFGWSPLVQDIHGAIDVLQGGVPPAHVKGSGKSRLEGAWKSTNDPFLVQKTAYAVDYTVKCGGSVKITNPNLWLANSLGLINPAAVAWDSVPFSFVVDWFVNVSDFLNGFTDLCGVEFIQSYTTRFTRYHGSYLVNKYNTSWGVGPYEEGHATTVVNFDRNTGLVPGPSLRVRPLKLPSVSRATTAISLLLQHLK